MTIPEIICEAPTKLDLMWIFDPITDAIKFKKRTKALSTHAEWMEKTGLVPKGYLQHIMDFPEDREYESRFDKIMRGSVDVRYKTHTIYFEQHTSRWKPFNIPVKRAFLKLYPDLADFRWVNLK